MRVSNIVIAAFLAASAIATQSANGETGLAVELNSASTPPTAFQLKRAEVQEVSLTPVAGDLLAGVLRKPDGAGPFPAAVLLHGCEGQKTFQTAWAKFLTQNGYVTLVLDSFTTRGQDSSACEKVTDLKRGVLGAGRVFDAYGALDFLAEMPFVNGQKIVTLAWTRESGISLVNKDSSSRFFDHHFAASVQFYPECLSTNAGGNFFAPLMILYPAENDWAQLKDCQNLAEKSAGVAPDIRIYSGGFHGFDDPAFKNKQTMEAWENAYKSPARGVTVAYSQALADKARTDVLEFLEGALGN